MFFKESNFFEIGSNIPNIHISESSVLYDFITEHLFVFLLTTSCNSCKTTLEELIEIKDCYHNFNFVIFINTSKENLLFLKEIFGDFRVHNISVASMQREFNINAFPWGYGINKKKEIISSNACSTKNTILALMEPFSYISGWEI